MKKILLYLCCLPLISLANDEIPIETEIKEVKLFLRGAQVFRQNTVSIPKGNSTLVFKNLEGELNTNSIQVSGIGNFIIMDIKQKTKYLATAKPDSTPKLVKLLRLKTDSLNELNHQLNWLQKKGQTLDQERNLILRSPLIAGTLKNDSLELLKNTAAYLRKQLFEIDSLLIQNGKLSMSLSKEKNRVNKDIQALNQLIREHEQNQQSTKRVNEIWVKIYTDQSIRASLSLNYLVNNASWYPEYDIKAGNVGEPIKLVYKARMNQQTGIDWENIDLTLSTNDPIDGKTKPILIPWNIAYYVPQPYGSRNAKGAYASGVMLESVEIVTDAEEADEFEIFEQPVVPAQNTGSVTVSSQQLIAAEFEIQIPMNIASNKEQQYMVVQEYELEASFSYVAVPKLNKFAYLMAGISDWQDIQLLPSSANLYFDGSYIGQTYIDPNSFEDTLHIGFGQDKKVVVERKLLAEECKNEPFTNFRNRSFQFEYKLAHQGAQDIPIIIEDQIPISSLKDLEVSLLNEGKQPTLEENTGFIQWKTTLKKGQQETWTSGFKIRYPKDKNLSGI